MHHEDCSEDAGGDRFKSVCSFLEIAVEESLKRIQGNLQIIFTGHSLGFDPTLIDTLQFLECDHCQVELLLA